MKCEQCSELIEDYFDGELNTSLSEQIDAHIALCGACAALADEIRQEHQLYAQYRRDVDVTPALWASVQARIEREKGIEPRKVGRFAGLWQWLRAGSVAPRLSPRLAVALVVVAIGITVGVMSYLQSQTRDPGPIAQGTTGGGAGDNKPEVTPTPPKQAAAPAPDDESPIKDEKRAQPAIARRNRPAVSDPDRLVREAEQKYRVAISILERGLKDRRRQLDPETRAQFDIALAKIDQTIEATRTAVRRNPADPIAVGYLVAAYSKKVDFLRDTARDQNEVNRPF